MDIKDVTLGNIDDLVNICVSPDRMNNPLFVEGMRVKKEWAAQSIKKYEGIAKLAYLDSKPVGLIQYQLNPGEKLVEITCIFVPEKENLRKGIGKSMLKALIEDFEKPKPIFGNAIPFALITWAFEVQDMFSQRDFYLKMGFKKLEKGDPLLLYYPLKKGYVPTKERKFIPLEEDVGKALIFSDSSCPWSIYFSEKIKESVKEVAPNIPLRIINKFKEYEKMKRRGYAPYLVVNVKPIETFFTEKEKFQKEIKQALEQ